MSCVRLRDLNTRVWTECFVTSSLNDNGFTPMMDDFAFPQGYVPLGDVPLDEVPLSDVPLNDVDFPARGRDDVRMLGVVHANLVNFTSKISLGC